MQVAETIRQQLGNRFVAMTGAHSFLGSADALSFRIGRNAARVTHVRVTLTPADLYAVTLYAVRGLNVREVAAFEGVYADALARTIGDACGLAVTL